MKNDPSASNNTAKLDALLGAWREPGSSSSRSTRSEAEWDDSADAIVQKALAQSSGSGSGADEKLIDSLLAAPSLEAEPGEPSRVVGDFKMSSDRNPPSNPPASVPPASMRPRGSLKELAQRVSKTPPPSTARTSAPDLPAATLKAATSSPPSSTATPLPLSAPPASLRIAEAPPPSVAPTSLTSPSQAGATPIPASAPPVAAVATSSEPTSKTPATLPTGVTPIESAKSKGNGGVVIGVSVAILGLAAAAGYFFYVKGQKTTDTTTPQAQEQSQPAPVKSAADKPVEPKPEQAKNDKPDDGALDINKLGDATASAAPVAVGGPLPQAPTATAVAVVDEKKGPVKVNPDGTLDDAMKKEAGPIGTNHAEPASETNTPKNLPDAPPQGSVTAAIGAVKGAAKACVSGADDVSSASVVFGSSGAVQSVSVSGWAAGKPAAACIQAALKGANVGPFSKPTFGPVPVTIRP